MCLCNERGICTYESRMGSVEEGYRYFGNYSYIYYYGYRMLDRATGSALALSSTLQSLKGPDVLAQHPEQG